MDKQGPMLFQRTTEIGEPHGWHGYYYRYVKNDASEIVAASDDRLGDDIVFHRVAFFYLDKRTGKAQLVELFGIDKKPATVKTGTCQQQQE